MTVRITQEKLKEMAKEFKNRDLAQYTYDGYNSILNCIKPGIFNLDDIL